MVHAVETGSRKPARTWVLVLVALVALFWAVVLFATWNVSYALFGWNLGADGTTLIYVAPGRPVAKAGIRAGDKVDWPTLPLLARANLAIIQAVSPNSRLPVNIRRGTEVRSHVLSPAPWPPVLQNAARLMTVAGLILVAIGIALVKLRPSRMTWAFLAAALLWAYPSYYWIWGQSAPWKFILANGTAAILIGFYAAGILRFMSRFPSDRPRGPLVVLDRLSIPLGVLVAILRFGIDLEILISPAPPPSWMLVVNQSLIEAALSFLALGALATTYFLTQRSDRQRIFPVLATFALYVLCTAARNLWSVYFTDAYTLALLLCLISASMLLLAAAVAYGVIRYRVLDVSFVVSRALVYTILTSLIVGVIVLIDFVSSKLIERMQVAMILEAIAALAFGICLNALHSRIDRFVDRVLFRRRHLAEARLDRASKTLVHAEDPHFVDEAIVLEPAEALGLASAAIFRKEDGEKLQRAYSTGWDACHAHELSQADHLVVHLRAELSAVEIPGFRWPRRDVPSGLAQPLVAIPLVVRHELLGILILSGHNAGEALDPDEMKQLSSLADAAAGAYDHLQAQDLRRQIEAAKIEIAQLRHAEELARQMVERKLSARPE